MRLYCISTLSIMGFFQAFLRALVEHTISPTERRRLQELCSRQGMCHYSKYIREQALSLTDVLAAFPSCKPPVELILGMNTVLL